MGQKLLTDNQAFAKLIQGYARLFQGDFVGASGLINEAQNLVDTWLGRFALGRVLLEAGEFMDASLEFEKCEKRRGEVMAIFLNDWPSFRYLESLQYYQGLALAGQNIPLADETLQKFLRIKENEDWGDPRVKDARQKLGLQ